jgi:hypothetical protein
MQGFGKIKKKGKYHKYAPPKASPFGGGLEGALILKI